MVQELAAADLGAPPSRYMLREKDRPAMAGTVQAQPELAAIPTIDVARLAEPGDVDEAAKLRSALQSWGLFSVTGHGMPEPFLDEILSATREFFHLPPEKEKYSNVVDGGEKYQNEGYGIDRVDTDEQVLDWCDRLYLQVQPEEERRPQFWPDRPSALRPLLEEYTLRSEQVFKRVLAAMARTLGFKEEFFVDKIMSNGVFMAPVHRVVTSDKERMSVVMFYQPEPHKDLAPSEELIGEEWPALYKKVKALGDGFWDAFAAGERTIDFLKVKVEQQQVEAAVSQHLMKRAS
ncbi:hypothetical protein E2562_001534 [Oryza meyeriana var. granulata]|uniref:Non-haem dioxygenase N-terminal domain-containing protein n=1 Tax=Oryza meyeriana var. granulata TaxID=110450 RepID=A0A6G1DD51_9ORYZ|nr:hypothetical protein E2562_001534 [Oryza meyeriana var. granulata]